MTPPLSVSAILAPGHGPDPAQPHERSSLLDDQLSVEAAHFAAAALQQAALQIFQFFVSTEIVKDCHPLIAFQSVIKKLK
jgi:hypothetical protein